MYWLAIFAIVLQLSGLVKVRKRRRHGGEIIRQPIIWALTLITHPLCESFSIHKPLHDREDMNHFDGSRPFFEEYSDHSWESSPPSKKAFAPEPEQTAPPPMPTRRPGQMTSRQDSMEVESQSRRPPEKWNTDPKILQRVNPPPSRVSRDSEFSEFEDRTDWKQGFELKKAEPTVHFINSGKVVPARGYAHLCLSYNLNITYQKSNMLQSMAQQLFQEYLARSDAQLPKPAPPPIGLSVGSPPPPEQYYIRAESVIRNRTLGPLSVMELLEYWYYLPTETRMKVASSHRAWSQGGKEQTPWFDRFLTISNPHLLADTEIYLGIHKGPWPHMPLEDIQQNFNESNTNRVFALDLAHLLSRASDVRMQAAALYDLPAKIGHSSIFPENKFQVDTVPLHQGGLKEREWTEEGVSTVKKQPIRRSTKGTSSDRDPIFDFSISPNQSPNPRRFKRGFFILFMLISTVLLVANTVMSSTAISNGLYTSTELRKIKGASSERYTKIKDTSTTIATQVNQNAKTLNDHADILVALARDIDRVSDDLHTTRLQLLLTAQLDTMQTEINALTDLMDHLAVQRITSAITASYNLRDDLAELAIYAGHHGNTLLIDQYTDILQCDASFIQENGELTATVHIPMGRKDEVMDLYQFIPYPYVQKGFHTMVAYDQNRYLVVNNDNTKYRSYTKEELADCVTLATSSSYYICQSGSILAAFDPKETTKVPPLFEFQNPTNCLMALKVKRNDLIKLACNLQVQRPIADVTKVNTNTFRIISEKSPTSGYVTCADTLAQQPFQVRGSYDLSLGNGCTAYVMGKERPNTRFGRMFGRTIRPNSSVRFGSARSCRTEPLKVAFFGFKK